MDGASTSCEQRRGPRDGWVLVLLAAWSLWNFARGGATAYDWPALDMAPYVARSLDRSYLENDFFTNASALPNPRQIYGGLLFGFGWAITGACPGPLFAQIGTGALVITVTLMSAIAGTWVYGYLRDRLPH